MIRKFEIRSTKSETKFKYLNFGISKFISCFVLIASCLLILAPHALAADSGFVALAPITGLTDISPTALVNSDSLANFLNNLYKYLIGLAAILAIIEIMIGGIEIAVNKENVSKITDSKGRIVKALWGLLLVLSPAIVFSIINPNILNLSIGLSPLNLPAPPATSNTGIAKQITAQSSIQGCTTLKGVYYQEIRCSTRAGRDEFVQRCTSGTVKVFDPPREGPGAIYWATCDTTSGPATGPYLFVNNSSIPFLKDLQPAAASPNRPDNGTQVMQFAQQCNADGGVFCIQNMPLTSASCDSVRTVGSGGQCYSLHIACRDPSTAANASNIPVLGGLSFNGCQVGRLNLRIIQ